MNNITTNLPRVFLSRRNLLTLLAKLDRDATGDASACSIIKNDNEHPVYPQTMNRIMVTAVEDSKYYVDRGAGEMHPAEERTLVLLAGEYPGG